MKKSPRTKRPKGFEERENTIYHVGCSGGKDSSAVFGWMVRCSGIDPKKIHSTFCDIGNDHEWTIEHVKYLSENVHPIDTIYPERNFFDLALHKKRFPSTKARFCTQHLKIYPTQNHITELMKKGFHVIAVSGVRRDESADRSDLPEWDYSGSLLCPQWRPIIRWDINDVLEFHKEQKIPLNPLYSLGAQRVGCWPCIMSRKAEIRTIALQFPERITQIRDAENQFETLYGRYSSFFARNTVPKRFRTKAFIRDGIPVMENGKPMMVATIDDAVRWSLSGKGAKGSWKDNPEPKHGCMSGYCE